MFKKTRRLLSIFRTVDKIFSELYETCLELFRIFFIIITIKNISTHDTYEKFFFQDTQIILT